MSQPDEYVKQEKEHIVCKLNRCLYCLKQASQQRVLVFDQVITSFGSIKNKVDK